MREGHFNSRLQPTNLRAWSTNGVVLDFEYCFNGTVSDFAQACSVAPVQQSKLRGPPKRSMMPSTQPEPQTMWPTPRGRLAKLGTRLVA
ncbi:MAG: hypothetical protein K6T87_22545 [Roseiflexus sp.]|jgi:hypothetical protein|uniref:hypothetical protein n=1 Tax=Roseiflexus sp. TaxID=2562120 RepID=UPI0025F18447|nr:hypothetical protein [Roseiflexus sp.]MCL6543337.1 hypothetical protein [Roseiflexus sp.]